MVLLRKIWEHNSLLRENLMTNEWVKNYLLIIQTVCALAYLDIWREREKKTCWHYLPRPLMICLASSSYSAENLQSIAFFTKTSILAIIVRHLNSVIFFLHIIFLQADGIAQSVRRLATRRKLRGWTPVAARFCSPFPVGTEANQVWCTMGIGAFYRGKAAGKWRWQPTPIWCRG